MSNASEPARTGDADAPPAESTGARPVGGILVAAALVFAAAVVASAAATVVAVFGADSSSRLIDELQLAADDGATLLHAGLLVGAALLLVAAEFHDVDSPWYPRAVVIVGGLACVAVLIALFAALDVPSWSPPAETVRGVTLSRSTSDRIAEALDGLSVAAIAGCAAAACRLLATGRIDFGPGRARSAGGVDDPE